MKFLKLVLLVSLCYILECNSSDEGELPAGFVACEWDRKAYDEIRRPKYLEECSVVRAELAKKKETCSKYYQSELGAYLTHCPSDTAYSRCLNKKDDADPFFKECGSKWDNYDLTDAQLKSLHAIYAQMYPEK